MKILFLANELLQVCGVSKHLYYLVDGLQKYYPNNEYFIITGGGNAIQKFQSLGVPVIVNENLRHETRSITGYIKGIKEVYSFVKRNDIQIVHSHHHYAANIATVVSKFKDVKTILTNHGVLPEVGRLNHFNAEHIIAVNDHIKDHCVSKKIKLEKEISVIRCGLPDPHCQKRNAHKLKVLAGGRFVKEKGFHHYIQAVAHLNKEIKNLAEFYIAGSGQEEKNLIELDQKLKANIIFLGACENFQEKLCESHIFVNPTLSEAEGFPTVLIEAGLAKNLVLSSKFRGHENILNADNSILLNITDHHIFVNKLEDAIINYKNYSEIIEQFNVSVLQYFSISTMLEKTNMLYKKLSM